ncbi:MAG: sensor histidine kinase, partial [Dehalococcoidia bacterium]|nr:sensor histidine kinase [Dehalococcoidia bacterium]
MCRTRNCRTDVAPTATVVSPLVPPTSEDDLPHIFSRFHRGRNTAAYPGSGLGLTIVKAIVEA